MPALPRLPQTLPALAIALAGMLAGPGTAATAVEAGAPVGWVPYGQSETGTFFFDPASVRIVGERKHVWRLFELKDPRPDSIQSGKALLELDCRGGTYRYLRTLYYGAPQGRGKYLGGAQAQAPEPIGPGSMVAVLAQKVC
jgi:hypothetical protein